MKPELKVDYAAEMQSSFANAIHSPDAFVAVDYNFKFLFINSIAEKFYRKRKSEIIGKNAQEVFPKEWNFGPFKDIRRNVSKKNHFEINYQSPFSGQWMCLVGRPFENYYTFTYKAIDHKTALNNELRKEVKRNKES